MTTLTPAQIAACASNAGFKGEGLTWAVAVALAESGGRTDAVHVNGDQWHSRDRGVWQINDHAHPDVSDAAAFNPVSCAQAAYRISSGGTSWKPWSTFTDGAAYAQYGRATMAVSQLGKGGVQTVGLNWQDLLGGAVGAVPFSGGGGALLGGDLPDLGNAIKAPLDAAKATAEAMVSFADMMGHAAAWVANPHNMLRIVYVVGGSAGVIIFLAMLAKSGAMGEGASKAAALPMNVAKKTPVGGALAKAEGESKTTTESDEE